MNRNFLKLLFTGLVLTGINTVLAQTAAVESPWQPSPSVVQAIKQIEYPAGQAYGIPEVKIPLISMTYGEQTLKLGLNYSATAIKVQEAASTWGMGWNMDGAGFIARMVRGIPDDAPNGYARHALSIPDAQALDPVQDKQLLEDIANGLIDFEPDLFYYTIGEYRGMFVVGTTGQIHLLGQDPIQLEFLTSSMEALEARLPDGRLFRFGTSLTGVPARETVSQAGGNNPLSNVISTWFLTDIVGPNNVDNFKFEYTDDQFEVDYPEVETLSYLFDYQGNGGHGQPAQSTSGVNVQLQFNSKKLSTITGADQRLVFSYGTRQDYNGSKLDEIKVEVEEGNTWLEQRLFEFTYDYDSNFNTRLRLRNVQEKSTGGNLNPYSFHYNALQLPSRTSYSVDHWGYYNGKNNSSYIPTTSFGSTTLGAADRNPDPVATQAGMLTTIVYPTGGERRFVFEANTYSTPSAAGNTPVFHQVNAQGGASPVCQQNAFQVTVAAEDKRAFINATIDFSISRSGTVFNGEDGSVRLVNVDENIVVKELVGPSGANSSVNILEDVVLLKGVNYQLEVCANDAIVTAAGSIQYYQDVTPSGSDIPVGGTRIKEITDYDPVAGTSYTRYFEYKDELGQKSSGSLNYVQGYAHLSGMLFGQTSGSNCEEHEWKVLNLIGGGLQKPGSSVPEIVYHTVSEYASSDLETGGKIVRKFDVGDCTGQLGGSLLQLPLACSQWDKGQLLEETFYAFTGQFAPVKKSSFEYEVSPLTISNLDGFKTSFFTEEQGCANADASDLFSFENYEIPVRWKHVKSETITSFDVNGAQLTSRKDYFYTNAVHRQLTGVCYTNSDGSVFTDEFVYPDDLTITGTSEAALALQEMKAQFVQHPVLQYKWIKQPGATQNSLISGEAMTFKRINQGGKYAVVPAAHYAFHADVPVVLSSYVQPSFSGSGMNLDSRFARTKTFDVYNDAARLMKWTLSNGSETSIHYGEHGKIILEIENSGGGEYRYGGGGPKDVLGDGIFAINYNGTYSPDSFNGEGSYGPADNTSIELAQLPADDYILSYWYKGTDPVIDGSGFAEVWQKTESLDNGWTYKERKLNVAAQADIAFAQVDLIDEVRVYPAGALMKTYQYDYQGRLLSTNDARGDVEHFEYDAFDRLIYTRDIHQHITKAYEYLNYTGTTSPQHVVVKVPTESVSTPTELAALAPQDVVVDVAYFDGLGAPRLEVQQHVTASKDLITTVERDLWGRLKKEYLPYAAPSSSAFPANALVDQQNYFNTSSEVVHTTVPFKEYRYGNGPTEQLGELGHEGSEWAIGSGQSEQFSMRTNAANEVRQWNIASGQATSVGCYSAATLRGEEHVDEDGHKRIQFYDKAGQLILDKLQLGVSSFKETYFVYDAAGSVLFKITPQATRLMQTSNTYNTGAVGTEYIESWVYNAQGRVVEEKRIGKDWKYYVYDQLGRVMLSQDGNQRTRREWSMTKYDALNRPVVEGVYIAPYYYSRVSMQWWADYYLVQGGNKNSEERNGYYPSYYHGYSYQVFPTYGYNVQRVMYYDDHDFNFDGQFDVAVDLGTKSEIPVVPNMVPPILTEFDNSVRGGGTLVGKKVRTLDNSLPREWMNTAYFHTTRGALFQEHQENHLGGNTITTQTFTPTGKLENQWKQHFNGHITNALVKTRTVYDDRDRPIRLFEQMDTEQAVLLCENVYNEVGKLKEKNLHSKDFGQSFLQSLDYAYNNRSWLTHINNADLAQQGHNNDANDVFGMELNYTNLDAGLGGTPKYNGKVGQAIWRNASESVKRGYSYAYDQSDRLTSAMYKSNTSAWNTELGYYDVPLVEYNRNDQLTRLKRNGYRVNGTFGLMDDLYYTYTGGLTLSITDYSPVHGVTDFQESYNEGLDFYRDQNGNPTADYNKALFLYYNDYNLPYHVYNYNTYDLIEYKYDAEGNKLRKLVWKFNSYYYQYQLQHMIDYTGDFVYDNWDLQYVNTAEGRIVPNNSGEYDYEYHIRDHEENLRMSFADKNMDGSIDIQNEILQLENYYPMGMDFAYPVPPPQIGPEHKFKFNGSELNDDFGLNIYFGPEIHDPITAKK